MTKLSRETEALLEHGRGGTPLTPAHRARLKAAILAKATGMAVVTSASSAAAWASLGAKIGGAVVLVAAVGGAGVAIAERVTNRTPSSLTTLAVNSSGADHGPPPLWVASTTTPTAISSAATPPTAASTTIPAWTATHPASQLGPQGPAPGARPASTTTPVPTSAGTLSPIAAEVPSSVVPTPGGLAASALTLGLESDVRLLRDADLAVKGGDPDRALALLDEHAAAFPRSELEPERSAERVFALCRAGRIEEARNATSTFLSAHPTGPLAARVKGACLGRPRE